LFKSLFKASIRLFYKRRQQGRLCKGESMPRNRFATLFAIFAIMLGTSVLSACGGGGASFLGSSSGGTSSGGTSSGGSSSGSSSGSSGGATAANIFLQASPVSSGSGSTVTVTITATVTDSNNVAVGSAPVSFVANAGCSCVLAASSATTAADGTVSATLSTSTPGNITVTAATTGSLSASTTVTVPASPNYKLGYLTGSTFTLGQIAISNANLVAGSGTGLQVTIYDTNNAVPYSANATVSFTSNCISNGQSTIIQPAANSTGTFNGTYTAAGCSGSDVVTATATLADSSTLTATGTITISPPTAGAVIFDGTDTSTANPQGQIGLKGTGQNETAKVYFKVVDNTGNPVSNATVNFSLSTTAGGLTYSPTSNTTDASGKVFTTVASGTVHTSFRVIASVQGTSLTTQSSLLTVSTGFPAQNAFSISASTLNIEGEQYDGITSTITVRLNDRYNNPVADGTAVSFQTECGGVDPQCTTSNGTCSVTFTSKSPRTSDLVASGFALDAGTGAVCSVGSHALGCDDHRCTVLATAVGEESFVDCNGTGYYVSASNPSNNATKCPSGDSFVSLSEAFQDNDENASVLAGARTQYVTVPESLEPFVDFNNDNLFTIQSGKFIGLLCGTDPNCDTTQTSLSVRKSIVIVMSESQPVTAGGLWFTGGTGGTFTLHLVDSAGEPMPAGTVVSVSYGTGLTAVGPTSYTVLDSDSCFYTVTSCPNSGFASGLINFTFNYTGSGTATFTVTTPKGVVTSLGAKSLS
jgi:hypothetical protein